MATGDPDPVANPANDLLSHLTPATDVGKGNITRHRTARLWTLLAEGVARKDIMKRFACRVNASAHSLETTTNHFSRGLGPVNPYISMMRGQPVYTYMVSVPHANKHLIRLPITIEPRALRRKGTHMDSSLSTPSVLLKADTGADVNLMNRKTFDQLFDNNVLKPYTHPDGELLKFNSNNVRNVPCFSQMEGQGL